MKIEDLKPLYVSDRKEDYGNIRRNRQQEESFTEFEKAGDIQPDIDSSHPTYRVSRHQVSKSALPRFP